MISYKRHKVKCTNCHSFDVDLTNCSTTGDNLSLGIYSVYVCHNCFNGFTYPEVTQEGRRLSLDVPQSSLNGFFGLLMSLFVRIRIRIVLETYKSKSINRLRVLDIGGGSCKFANSLAKKGASVTVIEPNKQNKAFASQEVHFIHDVFDRKVLKSTKYRSELFDLVTMWHSLEHCPNLKEVCLLTNKVLKKKGHLIIAVPNFESLQFTIGKNYWAYLDVPHHLFHFTHSGLDLLLSNAGYKLEKSYRFSLEYDLFGWQQTFLNLFTQSHNYFYNKIKKNRVDQILTFPRWTRFITVFQMLFLPATLILSLISSVINRPSCLVCIYQKTR